VQQLTKLRSTGMSVVTIKHSVKYGTMYTVYLVEIYNEKFIDTFVGKTCKLAEYNDIDHFV